MQAEVTGLGEALVLVPGGLTGWISWEPHAERLSEKRKVIRVQLLNVQYGLENRALPSNYSVKMESEALASTIGAFAPSGPLDLAAWSYGALVTLDYALDHQERVRSLTLIEPPAFWVLRAQGPLDAETRRVAETLTGLTGDISEAQLEQFACAVGLCPPAKSVRELPQWPSWMKHRQSLRNSPATLTHDDDLQRLRSFQRPVLLVKGTGSARFLHLIIDALAAELPLVRLAEFPGGHAPHIVSMERFLQEFDSFLISGAPALSH